MKLKELQKTVNVTWSPSEQSAILLAAGTAAQQIDNSVSSTLEIYSSNLLDAGYDLELKASQSSQFKFQKIIWSPSGFGSANPNGLIVGGCEGGNLQVYSASKLLNGEDALVAHQNKHSGAVRGLDFNPFQTNLLASVASESEIFIWDLNNTSTPMAPGTKTQPLEDVQSVAWNRQVQHILASVFSSRCVVWDLRKSEQIMKLSDAQSRIRWRAVQWHPEIATQLWLASEEDQAPYVQLWDLRYATAPAKTLKIHSRGVLGMTWCPKDIDLMISCGKDNKIYCWNPNTENPDGEILGEVATTLQWYSDIQWCPRNPALIASSSLEGNVSIYSLFGGTHQQVQTSNKIADSFPGMDQISQAPIPQQTTQFGGRLIQFKENSSNIVVNQVITEPELIHRANALEKTLDEGNYSDYCKLKADETNDQHGRYLWYFIKANFEMNPREEMLNLLGYNRDDITNKFSKYIKTEDVLNHNNINNITSKMATLTHSDSSEVEGSTDDSTDLSAADNNALFDAIAAENKEFNEILKAKSIKYTIPTGEGSDGLISEAIFSGNIEAAVELCMESGLETEALIIASTAGIDFLTTTQNKYLKKQKSELSNLISALITRNWLDVMTQCEISSWKEALVAALSHSDGQIGDLCVKLGERLQEESHDLSLARNSILCYICAGNLEKLVDSWLLLRNKKQNNSKLSTNELQELVEIVMLLKKSLELRGKHVEPTGKLAEFLSQYAGLLAGQGALDTALSYLGPTEDPELENLRERLYYALGHKKLQQQSHGNQSRYNHGSIPNSSYYNNQENGSVGSNNRFNPTRTSFSNPIPTIPQSANSTNFNTGLPGQQQMFQTMSPPMWNKQSQQMISQDQYSTANFNQGVLAPPPATKPPAINDALNYPQRPSSVGSQGSSGGPLTRNKYIVDPSVNLGPNYGQTMFNPAPTNLSGPPQQFSTMNNDNYQLYQSPSQQINATNFKPFVPAPTSMGNYLPGVPPIETASEALPPPPPMMSNPTPPPGWNDPPPVTNSSRSQKNDMSAKHAGTRKWEKIINSKYNNSANTTSLPTITSNKSTLSMNKRSQNLSIIPSDQTKVEQAKIAPITHPIFGVDPNRNQNGFIDQNLPYQNQNIQASTQNFQQQMAPALTQQSKQIFNSNQMLPQTQLLDNEFPMQNQMNFKTQAIPSQMVTNNQNISIDHALTNDKQQAKLSKAKLPLPEEYIYMQTVLEELMSQCINAAPDQRMKRKVSDISKRLDGLYDALREKRLSPNTINSLNQIVQFLQTGDYANALATHTSIVSGPDFSQTANFMPGIKILLQSAADLKVYLR